MSRTAPGTRQSFWSWIQGAKELINHLKTLSPQLPNWRKLPERVTEMLRVGYPKVFTGGPVSADQATGEGTL